MNSHPDDTLVQLKSLEALKDIANGEANKVFIPFEATSTLSSLGAIKEVMKDDKKIRKTTNSIKTTGIFPWFFIIVKGKNFSFFPFYLYIY